MEKSRALAVVHEPFAFEFSGIPRDREMHFLPARFGEIQSGKLAHGPFRAGMKMMPAARIHQGKLYFPRLVGMANRPIAALRLAAKGGSESERGAGSGKNQTHHSIRIHGAFLLCCFSWPLENIRVFQRNQLFEG